MMSQRIYEQCIEKSLAGIPFEKSTCLDILRDDSTDLLPLLNSAYQIRKKYFEKKVKVHVINNVANGRCSQDCFYCAQSKSSKAQINEYPVKSDEAILSEAKAAYKKGAFRYCMVFSGMNKTSDRIQHLAQLIQKIKSQYKIEVCVSLGKVDDQQAQILQAAGLDRINHNLNTSERYYTEICSTHTYEERMETLRVAHRNGLQICSGVIIGMGETAEDIVDMVFALKSVHADSIPVNFFIPIPGLALSFRPQLTPEYCLRVLCLFRFLHPQTEIRIAAGREIYLKSLESMALFVANSLFMEGYLNTEGDDFKRTLSMIKEAGFDIDSELDLNDIMGEEGMQSVGVLH